ncbi:Gfo/Idh/MocA family protein [Geminicoccus roseus]|uniref:Gfo/Idh/MocA family protein n=1 Tax=Geminicoccus roseus TaxID=404900 RepID=UPI000421AA7E|nr:Gfo/Idh/MocA family oxidoreductase [Geminicoccus roseus]
MRDGKFGFGLIGASTISRERMIGAMNDSGVALPVAVFSRDMARGRAFADEMGIPKAYDRLEDMLADPEIDGVYVASTNERHHAEVLAIAAAGKHVLCDKPLAMSVKQAEEMVRACEEAGVVFATNHHMRCGAHHIAMREIVRSGQLGELVVVRVVHGALLPAHLQTWRINDPATGAGAIMDLAVHDADIIRFLTGDEIVEVSAMSKNSGMGTDRIEDTALAIFRTANGTLGHIHNVFNTPFNRGSIEIHGTMGSLYAVDNMGQSPGGTLHQRDAQGEREIPLQHEELYVRMVRSVVAAANGQGEVACSGRDGLRSLAVALAMLESAQLGRAVAVQP